MARTQKTFRIFVSSTFDDMEQERNRLHEIVFPRLRELCESHGTRFQAIDLRWGVSKEAVLNQLTSKICIDEILRCQNVSPRPNFIILLGDRYGWQPLPSEIPFNEFKKILDYIPGIDIVKAENCELIKKWYLRDDNARFPVYCLQPRGEDSEQLAKEELEIAKIKTILNSALSEISKQDIPEVDRIKYFSSMTELEIIEGAFKVVDAKEHVFAFFRNIKGLPENESAKKFIDLNQNGTRNKDAYEKLVNLKNKLRGSLNNNIYEYNAQWNGNNVIIDNIEGLCDNITNSLSNIIKQEIETLEIIDPLEKEINDQKNFRDNRIFGFTGRKDVLQKIFDYLEQETENVLVLTGNPGIGKSSLIAEAIKQVEGKYPEAVILYRFIGITTFSSNGRSLLESVSDQINKQYQTKDFKVPIFYRELVPEFKRLLSLANKNKPLFIFIDALDQLFQSDEARNLHWIPNKLPENVHLVVSTLPDDCLEILKIKIPKENIIRINPMSKEDGRKALRKLLKKADRKLQLYQRDEVLTKFSITGFPLYLRLAFEEVKLWKSYSKKIELKENIDGIISDLFSRLSDKINHGKTLVTYSLSYLAAAKNGLTEDELIDVLSINDDIFTEFRERSRHEPPLHRLPVIVWVRLYHDLEPYFTEKSADNTTLINFFHNSFKNTVIKNYLSEAVSKQRHYELSCYFGEKFLPLIINKAKNINPRILTELPYNVALTTPDYFRSRNYESLILQASAKCIIKVRQDYKENLDEHLHEIKPICERLLQLNRSDKVIELTESLTGELEEQCHWSAMLDLLNSGMKATSSKRKSRNFAMYSYAYSKALLHTGNYNEAIDLSKKALKMAKKLNYKSLEAEALWHIGTNLRYRGKKKKAIKYIKSAEKIAHILETMDVTITVKSLITRGIIEHGLGHFGRALEHYNKAEEIADNILQKYSDENLIASSKFEINGMLRIKGDLGYQTNNLALARESWKKWLQNAENSYSIRDINSAKCRLSLIDPEIGLAEMKLLWKENLDIMLLVGEAVSSVTTSGELAEICLIRNEDIEAIKLCKTALKNSQDINNLHATSGKFYVRGILAIIEKNTKKAKNYLKKSEKFFAKWMSPYRYWVSDTFNRLEQYENKLRIS